MFWMLHCLPIACGDDNCALLICDISSKRKNDEAKNGLQAMLFVLATVAGII
jgi:hypothetical protein